MAIKNEQVSSIGPTTHVTGHISGRGGLDVSGTVRGSVRIDGPLQIGEQAKVEGPVEAERAVVQGSLDGDISARGNVAFGPRATFSGAIRAGAVTIAPGARISATLDTDFDLSLNI
jgi:cytoskeletal protein CcmA (bactofilin family)